MVELWIKFTDQSGSEVRVAVDKDKFTIGRHSENDLAIVDGRLSRNHAQIERFGDIFVISDRGSSNGTELNGERLGEPKSIKKSDELTLGGLRVELEFISDDDQADDSPPPASAELPPGNAGSLPAAAPSPDGGIPIVYLIVAPILGVVIIVGLGLVIYFSSSQTSGGGSSNFVYSGNEDDPPKNRKGGTKTPTPETNANSGGVAPTPENSNESVTPTPSANEPEIAKSEKYASQFLRKIAVNDPRAFVIGESAKMVNDKIKSISGSGALAANLNSARKNMAQLKTLAQEKNLKPELLTIAAIATLGGSTGDVLQTAQTIAPTLDRLSTTLSSELGEESLVLIAAFDQGKAGDFTKMRNMLQALPNKTAESARTIRTIWYLKKNGKITDGEFDFALRFLAIGTVSQNPKDFNVNAEPISF